MKSTSPAFPLAGADHFLESMGGDVAFCVDILETGLIEGDAQVAEIKGLTEASDQEAATRAFHSLRGAAATFEATSLSSLCLQMETSCAANGVKAILSMLGEFEREAMTYREGLLCLIQEFRARL